MVGAVLGFVALIVSAVSGEWSNALFFDIGLAAIGLALGADRR